MAHTLTSRKKNDVSRSGSEIVKLDLLDRLVRFLRSSCKHVCEQTSLRRLPVLGLNVGTCSRSPTTVWMNVGILIIAFLQTVIKATLCRMRLSFFLYETIKGIRVIIVQFELKMMDNVFLKQVQSSRAAVAYANILKQTRIP